LHKGGKEVWIEASYNPILDRSGKPFKVVKYAIDVTEQKLQTADFQGQIAAISKAQATIDFNMDGTVITANDNFLNALGRRPKFVCIAPAPRASIKTTPSDRTLRLLSWNTGPGGLVQ